MEAEKCFLRGSFTGACTSLTSKADVCLLLFPPRKEWRKVKERVLGSRWTFAYFQILLGNCEANYVYGNFSNCFSCRITDHKIMKAWLEKSLPFKLRAAQRRHRAFQLAAAELPYCHGDQATLRGAQKPHQTPQQISTFLMVFTSTYQRVLGSWEAGLGAPAALQAPHTLCSCRTPLGWSILPSKLQRQISTCRSREEPSSHQNQQQPSTDVHFGLLTQEKWEARCTNRHNAPNSQFTNGATHHCEHPLACWVTLCYPPFLWALSKAVSVSPEGPAPCFCRGWISCMREYFGALWLFSSRAVSTVANALRIHLPALP